LWYWGHKLGGLKITNRKNTHPSVFGTPLLLHSKKNSQSNLLSLRLKNRRIMNSKIRPGDAMHMWDQDRKFGGLKRCHDREKNHPDIK